MHTMKKSKAIGADEVRLVMLEMTGEVGVTWTGRLLNVCRPLCRREGYEKR